MLHHLKKRLGGHKDGGGCSLGDIFTVLAGPKQSAKAVFELDVRQPNICFQAQREVISNICPLEQGSLYTLICLTRKL